PRVLAAAGRAGHGPGGVHVAVALLPALPGPLRRDAVLLPHDPAHRAGQGAAPGGPDGDRGLRRRRRHVARVVQLPLHRDRGRDALGVPGAGPQRDGERPVRRGDGGHPPPPHEGRDGHPTGDGGRVTPRTEQDRRSGSPGARRTVGAMAVTVSTMFIPVHDPDEAIAFYCDGLGLEVRKDVAADGFRWVTIGAPGQEDLDVVLFQPQGGMAPQDADALLTLVTKGALQSAIFRTDDLDATFEKLRASGAEVLQEPADQLWGVRDCAFRDPSGNLLRIAQA